MANIAFRVSYSQRYLFNAIPDTNHSANPTNPNHNGNSKCNPNNTNPTNPNTRYRCEYEHNPIHWTEPWPITIILTQSRP